MPVSKTPLRLEMWHLIIAIVRQLTRPASQYDTLPRDMYRKIRALNATLLLAIGALVLSTIGSIILSGGFTHADGRILMMTGNLTIYTLSYIIVQRGLWQTVVSILFPSQLLTMFSFAMYAGEDGTTILYYMVFAMLWAGHFMSWRNWLLLIALHIALVTLHGWAVPTITLAELYRDVGLFTLVAIGIAVTVRAYQGRSYMRFVTELAHAEANLRVTIEASHDGYYMMTAVKDKQGEVIDFKIIEINDAACEQLNMTREQLMNGLICDLFPVNKQGGFFEQYKEVYETGVAIEQEYYIPEGMTGTGWFYHQVVKTRDGVVIINRDITQRKQFELDLVKRQNRLQSLIESQSAYLIRTDLAGNYTFANHRFLEQFGYDDIIGMNSIDSIHPDDHSATFAAVESCMKNAGHPATVSLRKIRKDGSIQWTDWEFVAVKDSMGKIIEIQCVGMDASARISAEEAKLEAERLRIELRQQSELNETKMRMMSRISHEFRTPLTVIRSSADLLTYYMDKLSEEKRAEKITNINMQIDRLTDMLNDMGLILQGQAKPHLIKQQCDLPALLKEIIMRYQTIEDQKRDYVVKIQADFPLVVADKDQMELLFTNLISNATKFSPVNKPVMLDLSYTDKEWIFVVRDEGIGILVDEQDSIFDPFFRGTNFGEIGGMGLGLSVVKKVVNAHNGLILVDSTPTIGTTITVKMPRE